MSLIKNGIIFLWLGTHASIPTGWSRVTAMDDTYPKGTAASTDPNTTGGAATHTHTSASHTHTITSGHTHQITLGAGSGGGQTCDAGSDGSHVNHTHGGAFTSGAIASASVSSVAATYGAVSNDPPYKTVIYVTPTNYARFLPNGVVALADAAAPGGFAACDGAGGTPDLRGKFLKGAAAGADAGGDGGSTQNIHALSHTHTTSHQHAATTSGESVSTVNSQVAAGVTVVHSHAHSVTLPAATPSTTDDVSLTTIETVEPAYTKLHAIQAQANAHTTAGIIALWLGALSAIPSGWKLCDGTGGTVDMRGRQLKIASTVGEVGSTGGSNTHTHASQSHSHTIAHTHTGTVDHSFGVNSSGNSGSTIATRTTTHAISTDSVNLVLDSASTSADSANNEPPYRTVAFIKLVARQGAPLIQAFIH